MQNAIKKESNKKIHLVTMQVVIPANFIDENDTAAVIADILHDHTQMKIKAITCVAADKVVGFIAE